MEGFRFPTIGVLLGSALVAGIITYALSMRPPRRITPQQAVMERAMELGDTEAARVGREFVSEKVVPEMKPVLIDLLKEAEHYVDRYFERAEKAIKSM